MTAVARRVHFPANMLSLYFFSLPLLCAIAVIGCMPVPIPYPTVILQPRSERPIVLESVESEKASFDPSGEFLAVYDSGSEMVRIFRISDMTPIFALRGVDQFFDPQSVAMSPDDRFVAGALPITAVPVTVPIDELYSWNYNGYQSIAFTPDSSMLVVCGTKLRIYRVSDLVTVPQ
jgi:hypothetical protein